MSSANEEPVSEQRSESSSRLKDALFQLVTLEPQLDSLIASLADVTSATTRDVLAQSTPKSTLSRLQRSMELLLKEALSTRSSLRATIAQNASSMQESEGLSTDSTTETPEG